MIIWQGRIYCLYYISIIFLSIITNIFEFIDIEKEIYNISIIINILY